MDKLTTKIALYDQGLIEKPDFIKSAYSEHHQALFDYSKHLNRTNIKKIEIEHDRVVMTSRDRGIRIECTPGDLRIAPIEILNFSDYEKEESLMMDRLLLDGDTFFDIGANIGWYSINIAVSRRNSKVFSFEPIKKTYDQLKKNISLNQISNIESHNFGLSDTSGVFTFYYYPEGSGNASIANLTGRHDIENLQCEVQTMDHYTEVKKINVDFIKCDVEGAELLVFKGGINTIKRDRPIVLAEILRKWSEKFNYNPNEIFSLFRQIGYKSYTCNGTRLSLFDQMSEETKQTNFFFLHADRHASLISTYAH